MVRARTFVFWKVCVLQVCWWVSLSLANTFVPRRTCWFVHNAWAFWSTSPLLEWKVGFEFKRVITHHRVINCRKCFLNSRWRWRDIDLRHGRVKFLHLFDSAAWSWTVFSSEHTVTASGNFSKPWMTEVHGKLLLDNILHVNFFEIVMHVRAA